MGVKTCALQISNLKKVNLKPRPPPLKLRDLGGPVSRQRPGRPGLALIIIGKDLVRRRLESPRFGRKDRPNPQEEGNEDRQQSARFHAVRTSRRIAYISKKTSTRPAA